MGLVQQLLERQAVHGLGEGIGGFGVEKPAVRAHGEVTAGSACEVCSFSRKPVSGLDAWAESLSRPSPARYARRPARTPRPNAAAISTGSPATAIAVLTSTASAPISIASEASDGAPSPASTTTGTVACSMMIC